MNKKAIQAQIGRTWSAGRAALLVLVMAFAGVGAMTSPAGASTATRCSGTLNGGTYDNVVVDPGAACILNDASVTGDVRVLADATLQANRNTIGGSVFGRSADGVRLVDNHITGNVSIHGGGPAPVGFPNTPEYLVCGSDMPTGQVVIQGVTGGVGVRYFPPAAGIEGCSGGNRLGSGNIVVTGNNIIRLLRVQNDTLGRGNIVVSGNNISGIATVITDNAVRRGSLAVDGNVLTGEEADVMTNTVGNSLLVLDNSGPAAKIVTTNTVGNALICTGNTPPFVGGPNSAGRAIGQCS